MKHTFLLDFEYEDIGHGVVFLKETNETMIYFFSKNGTYSRNN
jgi:hypothetical protein